MRRPRPLHTAWTADRATACAAAAAVKNRRAVKQCALTALAAATGRCQKAYNTPATAAAAAPGPRRAACSSGARSRVAGPPSGAAFQFSNLPGQDASAGFDDRDAANNSSASAARARRLLRSMCETRPRGARRPSRRRLVPCTRVPIDAAPRAARRARLHRHARASAPRSAAAIQSQRRRLQAAARAASSDVAWTASARSPSNRAILSCRARNAARTARLTSFFRDVLGR